MVMNTTLLNNRYQVIQVIGAGGFGETFLATDNHMPSKRHCAIKQLKPIVSDPNIYKLVQQRFEREAATLEYLGEASDQIPELYAYFLENGQFYLVQEWIEGPTLTKIVADKGQESEIAVRQMLMSLLPVLQYIHSKGIIHRDIKPNNIILRAADGKPVLIDFGAVKETMISGVDSQHNTPSIVIGTPSFMPGEQATGRPIYASDLYSLGLTAIYLLTGKHPQSLQTNPKTGEVLWQHYAPSVSANLATVLNKAIRPSPSDRYPTASKMLYALHATTSGVNPLQIPQTTAIYRSSSSSNLTAKAPNHVNWQKPVTIFLSLISLVSIVALAYHYKQQPITQNLRQKVLLQLPTNHTSPAFPSPPKPISPQPVNQPVTAQFPLPKASPNRPQIIFKIVSTPSPAVPQPIPKPTVIIEKPDPIPSPHPQPTPKADPTPSPSPSPSPVASLSPHPQPTPVTTETPPPLAAVTPIPEPEHQTEALNVVTNRSVPGFPMGTLESSVKAELGNPTQVSQGLWNTRALVYKYDPDRVDLSYLFDANSEVLRQTEVSFDQSVALDIMQSTLQGMMGGHASEDVKQGLQRVYQRQAQKYFFKSKELKGIIERNGEEQIYIGVWDADLH